MTFSPLTLLTNFSPLTSSWLDVVILAIAAALVGLSKTALPGASTITVAVFAAVLPAKQSTGALLVLLIVGDVFAVWTYHAHADWAVLRRLVPTVIAGVLLGTLFLATAGDSTVRRVIGIVLLALVAVTLARRAAAARRPLAPPVAPASSAGRAAAGAASASATSVNSATGIVPRVPAWRRVVTTGGYGVLAGFTTMVANAGGPVMSLYFLASRYSINQFLGTAAWFFFAVNLAKIPFSLSLGLISVGSLHLDLLLAPAVIVGALLGRRVAKIINQRVFELLVIVLTIVSSAYLVLA
jgi:hypothetical protein